MNQFGRPSLVTLVFVASIALTSQAQGANVMAKVNGTPIPQSRLDYLLKTNGGRPDSPDSRNAGRDMLISQELLYQEAVKMGYDKRPDVATQIELAEEGVVINAFLRDVTKGQAITEDAIRREYQREKALAADKEYEARHILVKTEDEAKQLLERLKAGASFEQLASENSLDQGSRSRGGDLGWAPPTRYVAPFGEALQKLKKGELTDAPVHTQFGWHLIRLDDERPLKFPPFADAEPKIRLTLERVAVGKVIAELRAKAKIE